jgi:predicted AAA+ superfamily ATPase
MREVSESLAGRMSLVELSPFLISELGPKALQQLWLKGGFPGGGVLGGRRFPTWQHDYVTLLAQRDLPAWGLPARPQLTQRLIAMVAALQGQTWNASRLGQNLGLTYHTVNSHLDYLEGAYLVRRLMPYSANLQKRIVKSPKVYLRDSGLMHALLGIGTRDELLRHPSVGASFEGFVIEQVLSHLRARGVHFGEFFFRTSDGFEIDLLLEQGSARVAIEIKLSREATTEDFTRLERASDLVSATHRYVVCQTRAPTIRKNRGVLDLTALLVRLDELFT